MEKRALAAVLLSFVIFFGYTKVIEYYYPNKAAAPAKLGAASQTLAASQPETLTVSAETGADETPDTLFSFENERYAMEFSETYGSAAAVDLTKFFDTEKKSAITFLKAKNGVYSAGALRLWVDGKSEGTLRGQARGGDPAGSTWTGEAGGVRVIKNIRPGSESYTGVIELQFENRSGSAKKLTADLSAGSSIVRRNSIDGQYIESNWIESSRVQHINRPGKGKSRTSLEPLIGVSVKSRHFSSILKPEGDIRIFGVTESFDKEDAVTYARTEEIALAAGETKAVEFLWYLGPNDYDLLQAAGLEQVVHFGKFDAICKLLIGGMQLAHRLTGNYGLAIILLTVFMNLLLTPLTRASFMSMQRMQLVQPEMNRLREKHKGDAARLNQEMMALYKKHKVNPMGGCLPMVVQMPVFMALYVALSKSNELLGAKFLWIKDLASPDALPIPFELPFLGQSIHLLPILMIGAMVAQQKISTAGMNYADPAMAEQQKIMLVVMPIVFGFIFYPMPSGLVLYWLTNTIFTTLYQRFLKSKKPAPAALPTRKL